MHNHTPEEPAAPRRAPKRPATDYTHEVLAETQINKNTPLSNRRADRQWAQKVSTCTSMQGAEQHRSGKTSSLPASQHAVEKNELCSYLNLLNLQPMSEEGNENLPFLKRRSHRLRNNQLLQEKKDLEKSLQTKADNIVIQEVMDLSVPKTGKLRVEVRDNFPKLLNGPNRDELNNLVTTSSPDIFCLETMDNNNETECVSACQTPVSKPKPKVRFAECLEARTHSTRSPPRANIEIAAYKRQAEQASTSIIQARKTLEPKTVNESRVPIVHFRTRIQSSLPGTPMAEQTPPTPTVVKMEADDQSGSSEEWFEEFHRGLREQVVMRGGTVHASDSEGESEVIVPPAEHPEQVRNALETKETKAQIVHFHNRIQPPAEGPSPKRVKLTEENWSEKFREQRETRTAAVSESQSSKSEADKGKKEVSQIIDVVHVASKAGPSGVVRAPNPNPPADQRSTVVLNDCEFVDMSRTHDPERASEQAVAALHDHSYCARPKNMLPPLAHFLGPFALPPGPNPTPPTIAIGRLAAQQRARAAPGTSHVATLPENVGAVLGCFYADYNLVVAQEKRITFFEQTGLGMFLESQSMWVARGGVNRLCFDPTYVRKISRDCLLHSPDLGVVYVELYCKEHKHDSCMVPGCDLFVVLYYRSNYDLAPTAKLHQLVKFTGFAAFVSFVALPGMNCVTVSYESMMGTMSTSAVKRNVTSYRFSADFQSVESIQHNSPEHRVCSVHVVKDKKRMVAGCGLSMISFWYDSYLVRTVELLAALEPTLTTFSSDRGFIFALQVHRSPNRLRLTAINTQDNSHKTLQMYRPPPRFRTLQQAIMRDGEVMGFYREGHVCWSMESGRLISTGVDVRPALWPCGRWMLYVRNGRVYAHRMFKAVRRQLRRPPSPRRQASPRGPPSPRRRRLAVRE